MLRPLMLVVFLFGLVLNIFSQPKSLTALKTTSDLQIDGNLDDAAWAQAPVATGFVQNFPSFGNTASTRTEVRILYDNNAIYIGAHLYDDPSKIRKQFTARDGEQRQDVDFFAVFLDTYNDQQNGFMFLVTSKNVQSDSKLNQNSNASSGDFGDKSWDAVWESNTRITENGWTVEMKIPYISLRFAANPLQTWGLQFTRFTRINNESVFWNPVDPNVNGFVNQFGKLTDLENIQPPLRLSFSPYVSTGLRINPKESRTATEWLRNGGMDVKYGLNESFTLDVTLIPDFGQVISDNVINNLAPFEIQFQENRPFFTEGTELFNKAGLFYSRRIGGIPSGYYDTERFLDLNPGYTLQKNPSVTQLY
nr:carbohydrate binding family 9 domain-containing protein [Flavisolibacter sp.]